MIIVRGVIADTLFEIVARRVDGNFVFAIAEVTTTALLVDGMENVKELADAG